MEYGLTAYHSNYQYWQTVCCYPAASNPYPDR